MRRLALIAAAVLGAALLASQLVLPRLAERQVRSELEGIGEVRQVDVEAWPALTLLVERADAVTLRLGAVRASTGQLGDRLASTRRTERLDARADSLAAGSLLLRDGRLRKRGARLEGSATLSEQALADASPASVGLRPVPSRDGTLAFEASAAGLRVRARLLARGGSLVVASDGLLGSLGSVTVFSDPRVEVTGVTARPTGAGYALSATGRLR